MTEDTLKIYRQQIDRINEKVLRLLSQRGEIIKKIGDFKRIKGLEFFDPERESEMLDRVVELNQGPYPDETIKNLFREIFRASLDYMDTESKSRLKVSRHHQAHSTVINVKGVEIGGGKPVVFAGPCAIEGEEGFSLVAARLREKGVRLLRGGAFKPRTSPYSFQGLGQKGLEIMRNVADRFDMVAVTEVTGPACLDAVLSHADILQVGTRSMSNFELLKLLGAIHKPVLLKRGFMATIEEFLFAAEYIASHGNSEVILCERGIRTFEKWTRNTLDISAIPLLKKESHLPVIVDLSHSTGRKDIIAPLAMASLSAGADGIMVEVHHNPSVALSDNEQQLSLAEFDDFIEAIKKFIF